MATYDPITGIAVGNPVNAQDGLRLRDNPLAMFEQAAGAPRYVQPYVSSATTGTGSSNFEVTFDLVDGYRSADLSFTCTPESNQGVTIYLSLSTDGGSSWGTESTLIAFPATSGEHLLTGRLFMDAESGEYRGHVGKNDTATYSAAYNGTLASAGSSANRARLRFLSTSGNLDAGATGTLGGGTVRTT